MILNAELMEHFSEDKAVFRIHELKGSRWFPDCFVLTVEASPNHGIKFYATRDRMQELADFIHSELQKYAIAAETAAVKASTPESVPQLIGYDSESPETGTGPVSLVPEYMQVLDEGTSTADEQSSEVRENV